MDISKASNFERFVFDLLGRDAEAVRGLWGQLASAQGFDLSDKLPQIREKYGFVSGKSLHADRLATIRAVYEQDGELLDPHTADGVKVARALREAGETVVCLETALAAKFEETIAEAVGAVSVPRPQGLADLESRPQTVRDIACDADEVKKIIREKTA